MADTRSKMILEFEFNNKSKGALGKVAAEMQHVAGQSDDVGESVDRITASETKLGKESKRVWGAESKALKDQITNVKALTDATNKLNTAQKSAQKSAPTPRATPGRAQQPIIKAPSRAERAEADRLARLERNKAAQAHVLSDKTPIPGAAQAQANADREGAEFRRKQLARELRETAEAKRARDDDQNKALREGADPRSKAIFRDIDFAGSTAKIKEQHRELIIVTADLERYQMELKQLQEIERSGGNDSPYEDLAVGIDHVTGKVKEYAGYVSLVTKNINDLEDAEKKLIARQATKGKLEAARARAAATRESGPSGGFIEMGYKADKIQGDELYAQYEKDEAARAAQQKPAHPTVELSDTNRAKRDSLDAMRAEKQKEFDDRLLEGAGLAEENQTAHAKAAREQLKLQEMVLMKHENSNEQIEEQIRLTNLAKEAAQNEAQARKDAAVEAGAVEDKLRAARGQIRVPDDLAKIREYEEKEPHKYGPYLNQKAARDAMQPPKEPPAPPPGGGDDDDDDSDSKNHKAALKQQQQDKLLLAGIDRERLALQARLAVATEAEGAAIRQQLANLGALEQQQAKLAALKSAEFQAGEKVIAAQREAVALEAQLENAATEKGQEQRAQLALLRVEEQQQAKLAALLSQQHVEGEQIIAGEKEKIALRARLETATEAEGAAIRQQLAVLGKIEQQRAQAAVMANEEYQAQHQALDLDRQKLALENKLKTATDAETKEIQQQLAVLEKIKQQKAWVLAMADKAYRHQEKEIAAQKEVMALENKLRTANTAETAELQKQLAILDKERQQRAHMAAMSSERYRAEQRQLSVMQAEQALGNQIAQLQSKLNNPALLAQERERLRLQQQMKEAVGKQPGAVDKLKGAWQKFGSFIGPFSAGLQTGISAAWYLKTGLEFFRDGSLSKGIHRATQNLKGFVDESKIAAATGGVLSKREAAQAGMRGTSLGFRGGDNAAAAQIAAVAANIKVLHGEAGSLKEAMVETLQGVQQEIAAGEIGENLKKAGVHSATYNQALAQEAARRGILVESLDAQTKQQILLAHATNETTDKLVALRNKGLEQAAEVDNYLNSLKERMGVMLSGGEDLGIDELKAQYLKNVKQLKTGAGGGDTVGVNEEDVQQSLDRWSEAVEKQNAMRRAFAEDIINQDAALFAGAASQMGEDGAEQIKLVREGFDELGRYLAAKEKGFNTPDADVDAIEKTNKDMAFFAGLIDDTANRSKLLKAEFWEIAKANLQAKDAAEAKAKFEAALVPRMAADAKARKMSLEFELKNNIQLDMVSKREMAGKIATLAIDEQIYDLALARGKTYDEAVIILNSAEILRRKELATTKAQLATQLTLGDNLTKIQKEWYATLGNVQDVKFQANELTETTTEYRIQLGKAAGIQFFEKLGGHIGFSTEKLGGLAKMLGIVAGNLDDLTNGSILTDNFLGRIWSKVDKINADDKGKKDKTGSGKKDDDMLERLRRERIERQIADAATLGDVTSEAYEHQKDFIEDNLKEVSKAYEATYGDMGAIDQTMRGQLARLEWQYADGMKQAGEDAAKQKAIKGQLYDQLGVMQKEMEMRSATFFTSLEEGLGRYATATQVKLGEASVAWQAHIKEYEVMQQLVADAQKDINARALDNMLVDEVTTSGPQRKLSDGEKGAVNARAEAAAQMKEVLDAHQWSADQKLVIEANYQAKLYEIEQQYNQARYDENQRIRDVMAADAQAALAETQELMSHFSDEARSMSEAGQATFQGGLSTIGMKSAEALDGMMAGMIGYIGVIGEVDKAKTALAETEANSAAIYSKGAAGIISAGARAADGVIKSERWKAGIKGAVHTAESIGDFASGNVVGGTMHALAAAKFFVIAGTASEAPAKAKKAEATKRTALSQSTVALSRDRGMTAWTQVFIQLHPITGEEMVSTMNDSARRGNMTGRGIDSRLTRPTATVRTEV